MSINFSDLMQSAEKEGGFSLLPDGPYNVVVEKAEAVTASTGNPMLKVTLIVTDGPFAKRKLFTNHVMVADNPNALAMFFRNMQAYGLGKEYWNGLKAATVLDGLASTVPILIGKTVVADVGHKVWKGDDRNEVKGIKAGAGIGGPVIGGGIVTPTVVPQVQVPQVQAPVVAAPPVQASPGPQVTVPTITPVEPVVASGDDEEPF